MSWTGRAGRTVLIAAGELALGAAPAHAVTAKISGHDVVIDSDAGRNDVRVTLAGANFKISDLSGPENAKAGCSKPSSGVIACPAPGITRFVVTLGLGDDKLLVGLGVGEVRAVISGEAGDDRIAGGPEGDNISGGLGDDTIEGSNDELFPGEPNGFTTADDTIAGGTGDDELHGGNGDDDLSGGDGNDELFGEDDDDTLVGGKDSNLLDGGEGSDRLVDTKAGRDTFTPGADFEGPQGEDVVDYSAATRPVTVDMEDQSGDDGEEGGRGDRVSELIDRVIGGSGDDHLISSTGGATLEGRGGADLLEGGDSTDILIGGPGGDDLRGGPGGDAASYEDRTAGVVATISPAAISGNATDGPAGFRDKMQDVERLTGGSGPDVLTGDGHENILLGGKGDDRLVGNGGNDSLAGAGGQDTLDGGNGGDRLNGGDGIDAATYAGRADPVTVTIASGVDDDGNDFDGPAGDRDDVVASTEGVIGGSADDTLTGTTTDDRLFGGAGNDSLAGSQGNDTLNGGPGTDTIGGGAGVDTADYSDHTQPLVLDTDGVADEGIDTNGDGTSSATEEQDLIKAGVENLIGGSGADRITGSEGANNLNGGPGADVILGGAGADRVDGGTGEDDLKGESGNDTLLSIDGEADQVSCGSETDLAFVDLADGDASVVPPVNFAGCETIHEAAKDQHPTVRIAGRAHVRRGQLRVRLTCPRALSRGCRGRLEVARATRHGRVLGKRRYHIKRGKSRTVAVTLSRRASRRLRRAHRVRLVSRELDRHGEPKLSITRARATR